MQEKPESNIKFIDTTVCVHGADKTDPSKAYIEKRPPIPSSDLTDWNRNSRVNQYNKLKIDSFQMFAGYKTTNKPSIHSSKIVVVSDDYLFVAEKLDKDYFNHPAFPKPLINAVEHVDNLEGLLDVKVKQDALNIIVAPKNVVDSYEAGLTSTQNYTKIEPVARAN